MFAWYFVSENCHRYFSHPLTAFNYGRDFLEKWYGSKNTVGYIEDIDELRHTYGDSRNDFGVANLFWVGRIDRSEVPENCEVL